MVDAVFFKVYMYFHVLRCGFPLLDHSQAWCELPPLPRPKGAPGAVGHVDPRRHPSLYQGVVPTGGRARHFLQTAKGHNLDFYTHAFSSNFPEKLHHPKNY